MNCRWLRAEVDPALVASCVPLARAEAYRFAKRRSDTERLGGRDALLSAAYQGLLHAALAFDPTRGRVKFSTYATIRVKGSLLDHTEQIARSRRLTTVPLECEDEDEEHEERRSVPFTAFPEGSVVDAVFLAPLLRRLARQFPKEARVIDLRFREEWTREEIATELELSESRIQQLQQQALRRLREWSEEAG